MSEDPPASIPGGADYEALLAQTRAYYAGKLEAHGPTAQGMDWSDAASQHLRFDVIARHMDWPRCPSVLDVGCGAGEFLAYCQARGLELDYTGLDLCPEMVEACNLRFGRQVASTGTLAQLDSEARYDYVIASGTFNVKQDATEEAWRDYLHESLRGMYAACRAAIVFNVMTAHVDYRYDHLYYASLQELGDFAVSELSRQFVIDRNYPLWELTCAVFREGA